MRKEFELTDEQLEGLLNACKPVPCLFFNGIRPSSPQENANRAWKSLGEKLGFDYMTVQPTGKGDKFFTAEVAKAGGVE